MSTHHGTKERVSWTMVVQDGTSSSSIIYGEDEDAAREHYARRAKYLHRGLTVHLQRTVAVESWIQHTDIIESFTKPKLP